MLKVQPNTMEVLRISAIPIANKSTDNQLLISIKNNPKVEIINLTSECCKLEFSVTPQLIQFERVLINRAETKSLFLENESLVPISWEFTQTEGILQHFNLSQLMGYIPAKTTQEVFIDYFSEVTQDVPKQAIGIEVSII